MQNGWQVTGQRNEQQQTAKHTATTDYLLISSISHNSVRWSVAAERQSGPLNLGAALSPRGWGGSGGPLKGWGHFLCLRVLAGKIKCLHSVSPALFQMPPLPFKRPLWAWMANERFWVLAVYSFSLSLCHPQSPAPSVMQTPNLCFISTVNVKVQRQIHR